GQGHWADSRKETGRAIRSRGSSRDREPSRRTAIGRWYRTQAPGADRACVAGSEASTGDHAVPPQPWREHQPCGANLQDLWRAGVVADAYGRLPVVGGNRRRTPDLLAAP